MAVTLRDVVLGLHPGETLTFRREGEVLEVAITNGERRIVHRFDLHRLQTARCDIVGPHLQAVTQDLRTPLRPGRVYRNLDTPEGRAFWELDDALAKEVDSWPAWKRAGINVTDTRRVPRKR